MSARACDAGAPGSVPTRDRWARVALNLLVEPGDARTAGLVARLGAEQVYRHLLEARDADGVATDVASRLADLEPEAALAAGRRAGVRFVCPGDDEWPERLGDLDRAGEVNRRGGVPLGLWVRGPGRLDEVVERSVAVVGSRSATTYGAAVAGQIAAHLAGQGVSVVSGAAFGIDQAAHRGALAGGAPTLAVLACGADRAYPSAHRDLLAYVAQTGLVVSETPPGGAPTKLRFLSRNRLIAALSLGTVVVEAAVRSGALNTANWAGLLGRAVMGVPGPVTSAPSEGVHELLRTRDAALVTCGSDVLELVSPVGSFTQAPRRAADAPVDRLPSLDRQVLDAVPVVLPASPRSLARTAGLAEETVRAALPRLAAGGFVERSEGGWRLSSRGRPGAPGR